MVDVTLAGAGGGAIAFSDAANAAAAQAALATVPPPVVFSGTQPNPGTPTTIVFTDASVPTSTILSTPNTPVIFAQTTAPISIQGSGVNGQVVVAGSGGLNFATGGGSSDITPLRAWGNRCLNRTANVLFGTGYTDLCYGYNAFWTSCLPALELDADGEAQDRKLWGDGFEIETIINTRIAKANLRIVEVPSYEFDRIHGESNLNTWRDGTRVLRALMVERLNGKGRNHTPRRTLAEVTADPQQETRISHGQTVLVRELAGEEGDWVKLVNRRREFIAVGTVVERIGNAGVGIVQPKVVFR